MQVAPFRVDPFYSPRPWGTLDLAPWLFPGNITEPIGEAWFTGGDSIVATGQFAGQKFADLIAQNAEFILGKDAREATEYPLLIKLLFPRQKLSVQVHPDDTLARQLGHPRGKTECWYVLDSDPNGAVALGFKEKHTVAEIKDAVSAETLETLLNWIPVAAGDMIFVDAGTVHAIGPGVVLLEVQQQSDLTYRMYDYGRGRELHLELGFAAMRTQTAAGKVKPGHPGERTELISTDYFKVEKLELAGPAKNVRQFPPPQSALSLFVAKGSALIETGGEEPISLSRGQLAVIPATSPAWRLSSELPLVAIVASTPAG